MDSFCSLKVCIANVAVNMFIQIYIYGYRVIFYQMFKLICTLFSVFLFSLLFSFFVSLVFSTHLLSYYFSFSSTIYKRLSVSQNDAWINLLISLQLIHFMNIVICEWIHKKIHMQIYITALDPLMDKKEWRHQIVNMSLSLHHNNLSHQWHRGS